MTGISEFTVDLVAKRLGLLHEIVPNGVSIALLINPANANADVQVQEAHRAAAVLGLQLLVFRARNESEIGAAFTNIVRQGAGALVVAADTVFNSRAHEFVALSERHAIPAIYPQREYAIAGGLMSYASNLGDAYRLVGVYTARILKGE